MLTAILLTIAKNWKYKCTSTGEQKIQVNTFIQQNTTQLKGKIRREGQTNHTHNKDLKSILSNDYTQAATYCMVLFIRSLRTDKTNRQRSKSDQQLPEMKVEDITMKGVRGIYVGNKMFYSLFGVLVTLVYLFIKTQNQTQNKCFILYTLYFNKIDFLNLRKKKLVR